MPSAARPQPRNAAPVAPRHRRLRVAIHRGATDISAPRLHRGATAPIHLNSGPIIPHSTRFPARVRRNPSVYVAGFGVRCIRGGAWGYRRSRRRRKTLETASPTALEPAPDIRFRRGCGRRGRTAGTRESAAATRGPTSRENLQNMTIDAIAVDRDGPRMWGMRRAARSRPRAAIVVLCMLPGGPEARRPGGPETPATARPSPSTAPRSPVGPASRPGVRAPAPRPPAATAQPTRQHPEVCAASLARGIRR